MSQVRKIVSVPYEITLLSNTSYKLYSFSWVSVPYEITLLSNRRCWLNYNGVFQYLMKLHYSQTPTFLLWKSARVSVPYEITLLSNEVSTLPDEGLFQYLMKLHYSQTIIAPLNLLSRFQYLMKLHYSQTQSLSHLPNMSFSTL